MGNSRWDPQDWDSYAKQNVHGRSQSQIFTSQSLKPEYDPAQITMRESCDSEQNPNATPIILGSDVTGSMGIIAQQIMEKGLNTLCSEIYERAPVPDPHIMVLAIGDAKTDSARCKLPSLKRIFV